MTLVDKRQLRIANRNLRDDAGPKVVGSIVVYTDTLREVDMCKSDLIFETFFAMTECILMSRLPSSF